MICRLISAPTASAREDLDITRENVAAAGGVAAAVRGMRAHPDEVMVQLAGAWLIETLMRWTPTGTHHPHYYTILLHYCTSRLLH
eukprot:COSAG06_NODE_1024_length_11038_cov_245.122406_7_plen_85_part_00